MARVPLLPTARRRMSENLSVGFVADLPVHKCQFLDRDLAFNGSLENHGKALQNRMPKAHYTTPVGARTTLALVLLIALFVPSAVYPEPKTTACPPPPTTPTADEIQVMVQNAKDRGFLWRYEKNGNTGYLYGSIHVGRREWIVPGPKTMAALQSAGVIALELDILDPKVQQQMSDPSRFGIKKVQLPPSLKLRMETIAKRVCAPVETLEELHPLMQLITVTIHDARFSGLELAYGSEIFLAGFSRGAKKRIEGLETPELQMHALLAGEAQDIIETVESGLTLFETGKQRTQTDRLINAWATRNIDELQRYEEWCECMITETDRKYMKGLLDDRNPHLAASIDKLSRDGRKVFAAVGSLHLIGPNSVPKQLEKMGYKIERVVFEEIARH